MGNCIEKMLIVMYKLELYDAHHASWHSISMPDEWHTLACDVYAYLKVVKKSRKTPRNKCKRK